MGPPGSGHAGPPANLPPRPGPVSHQGSGAPIQTPPQSAPSYKRGGGPPHGGPGGPPKRGRLVKFQVLFIQMLLNNRHQFL